MIQSKAPAFETQSVWLADGPTADFPSVTGSVNCDVAVVGAGITGLTAALLLRRAGHDVVVLEADRVGFGVTGYSTAKLTSLHTLIYARLEKQFGAEAAKTYAAANEAGIRQIRTLVDELKIDCQLETQPAITYTRDNEHVDKIRAEVDAADRAGLPATFTADVDLPFTVEAAIKLGDQAQFHPYQYCAALAREITRLGAKIHERSRVVNVEPGDRTLVATNNAEIRAKHVILSTLLPIYDPGAFFARAFPSRTYGIDVTLEPGRAAPEGMYISVEQPTRSVRPRHDRRGIIVVGETHKVGQDDDTRQRFAALEGWARENFAVASVDHRWSAQDFMAADGLPFIGKMPLANGSVLLATGYNKWGLSTASFAAQIFVDLIENRENVWASLFEPSRANLTASATKLISENANVAKHYVGDWIKSIDAPSIGDLPPGAAAICTHKGEKVAAFRDESGVIHAVSPICTHMGCYVQWNAAEKSWDCPCHGSRFSVEGEVLQSPAVKPLSKADLR